MTSQRPQHRQRCTPSAAKLVNTSRGKKDGAEMGRKRQLSDLPQDVLLVIFSFLKIRDIGCAASVCRQWSRLAKDPSLSRTVDLRNNYESFTWTEQRVNQVIHYYMSAHTTHLIIETTMSSEMLRNLSLTCPGLETLVLCECELRGKSPYKGRISFQRLRTFDWRMTAGFLTEVAHLTVESNSLENLVPYLLPGLGQRLIGVSGDELFVNQSNLRMIDCHESEFITDRSLETLALNCPLLESASFINCPHLNGSAMPTLISGCPKLQTLRMRGVALREAPFQEVNWEETSLIELDLQNIPQITDVTLVSMLSSLRQLGYLRCPVTDMMLTSLRSSFPDLQVLKLRSGYPLSQELLAAFLCACPNLNVLDINLEPVGAQHFAMFLPCLPNMKYLNIGGDKDTPITVRLLSQFCPSLKVLSIQFYRAFKNSKLADSLVDLIQTCQHVKKVLVSGVDIKPIIDQTHSALDGKLGTRRVEVIADECFKGMEVIPPMNSLDYILGSSFPEYQAISEKRLSHPLATTDNRVFSERRA